MNHIEAVKVLREALDNADYELMEQGVCFSSKVRIENAAVLAATESIEQDEPVAWMRKWVFDKEKPGKVKNENNRMVWPYKFKFHETTIHHMFSDDVALFALPQPAKPDALVPDELLKACRGAVLALAHASENNKLYKSAYEELSNVIDALPAAPSQEPQS